MGHTFEGVTGTPLHQPPARAAFTKELREERKAILPAIPASRKAGGAEGEQGAAAIPGLPLSQTLRFSPPAPVGLSPACPAPGDGICSREFLTEQKGSGTQHSLFHLTFFTGNDPSGESRRYLLRKSPPVPPGRAGSPRSGRRAVPGQGGARRPLSRDAPGARPRSPLDEGAVCAQAQARAASGAGSAPGAPGGLCRGRALRCLPELFPLILPPGEAQRDPLCCREDIVLFPPSQAVMFCVFLELPEDCHSA